MKRTPLKRKTPLRTKVGLKRTPIKIKSKRFPIPKNELVKVDERAGGKCEFHTDSQYCVGKLVYAHIKHRKMGGVKIKTAHIINNHKNIVKVCEFIHDVIDNRIFDWKSCDSSREKVIETLKQKIGWYGWYEENKGVINY